MIHTTTRISMPPVGVGIDRTNPLNRGLTDCYLFNSPGFAFNIARGVQPWAIFDSGGKMGAAPFGYGLRTDGTSTGGAIVTSFAYPAAPWSVEAYVYTRTTAASQRCIWRYNHPVSGDSYGVNQSASNFWSLQFNSLNPSTAAAVVGKPTHLVVTNDTSVLSNSAKFFVDGVLLLDIACLTNAASTSTLYIGRDSFNQNFAGTIAFLKVYNRLLAPAEVGMLSHNPFQFLVAQSGFNYFADAAVTAYDASMFQAMLMQTQGGAAMIGMACRGVYG